MSEQPKTIKIPHLPNDQLVTIEVSGGFLKRCQGLLLAVSQEMGVENVKASYEKFKNTTEGPADIAEATLYIMTALVGDIEQQAIKQGKTTEVDMSMEELSKVFGKI